ncbi:MAG: PIN domain-containing protein [Planctomycetota bacterium]
MSGSIFVDTNVLVYAHDQTDPTKNARAQGVLLDLWATRRGTTSAQVLLEFFTVISRKVARPIPPSEARTLVSLYLRGWPVVWPSADLIESALGRAQPVSGAM